METKSIEERAKELSIYPKDGVRFHDSNMEMACIQIATEQREIDIQKAIEWLKDNMQTNYENVCIAESKEFETHTEFIARFEKAMKGE